MKKKPRRRDQHIIDRMMGESILIIGILITLGVLSVFWYYTRHFDIVRAETIAFTLLVMLEIVRLYIIRSNYHISFFSNGFLIAAIASSIFLQLLVVYTPLNKVFETVPLNFMDWMVMVGVIIATLIMVKIIKVVRKRLERQTDIESF